MQSSEGNAQDSERGVSTGIPRRLSESARSDDDYDLNAFAVSDGFRPTQAGPDLIPSSSTPIVPESQPPPPAALASPPSKSVSDTDRPSSTSKPPRTHDSLTLRNDGSSSARRRDPPVLPSLSNGVPLIQPETPYQGPSGPSHPYQMYPQRTFSNATASTAPNMDRQSYDGPRGPTHPYTLYTQNTAVAEETAQQHIPVGFTNLGNSYQRQIGPDGEEAGDLIGPLGHLEELPPYTRYPEETYARRKSPEPVQGAPNSAMPAIPGAGGIGIATRDPEFSSTEDDLALPPSRPASQGEVSQHEVNTAARGISEKPTMTKWQRRARKKMWGIIPYWAICLLVMGLVIMGVVMGSVIGTVLANNHSSSDPAGDEQYDVQQPTPTAGDIAPYSTLPADLPVLPTGFFALPPLDTSQAPKSCFSDTTQSQSWSCEMPFRVYSMDIGRVPNATNTSNYVITLTAFNSTYAKYIWGTQPPDIPDPRPLTLVADTFEESRGPAWWLSISYDKTVIVPEESLRPSLSKRGGSIFEQATQIAEEKLGKKFFGAQDGDKPWICTWPDTTLEIFIYPSQNVTMPAASPPPGATQTATIDYAGPTTTPDPDNPVISYPKVVKFLERRWGDDATSPPTCRQVQIINDGHGTKDVLDKNGHPVEVIISENVQSLDELLNQRARIRHGRDKQWGTRSFVSPRALELTDCGCLWWST